MKAFAALLLVCAGFAAGSGHAQTWIVFYPLERDFRVLFPNPPVRTTLADGSIVFRSAAEDLDYFV